MLAFEWPWLFLLFALPWLIKPARQASAQMPAAPRVPVFSALQGLGSQPGESQSGSRKWLRWLQIIAWLALVTSVARPQWIGDAIEVPVSGRDLMLAVDISPSMKEEDMNLGTFSATRLTVVKSVVGDFLEARKGDRVGLILFGSQPYIQTPLTFDLDTVRTLLNEADLGMAGRATAIGDALALGVKKLRDRPQESRVLILLTDGANTAGEVPPEKAAQLAEQSDIKVYTIGIGAEEMIQQGLFGSRKVNPSRDLDETMLKQIADVTGGQFFRARNTGELELIYEALNRLEPIEQEQRSYRPTSDLFHWPLAVACLLFGICLLAGSNLFYPTREVNP